MLGTFLTVLLVIVCIVMIFLVIILQQGNEGGIGSAFGSGNSTGFFGASGGVSLIVRATWICGALFFVLATGLAWVKTRQHFGVTTELERSLQNAPGAKIPVPSLIPTPASGPTGGTAAPIIPVPGNPAPLLPQKGAPAVDKTNPLPLGPSGGATAKPAESPAPR